jgi:hypothetical protein
MTRRLVLIALIALPAFAEVSPAAIRAHINFLASDLLEGRGTGTRGFDLAAQYVESQFESAGLQPAGDSGAWQQRVQARTAVVDEAKCSMTVDGRQLVHRRDVLFRPNFAEASSDAAGEIVLAGFGITAPELGHDDYARVDVRGKIVLVLSGAPARFPADQRAFYSDRDEKLALAGERGAIGVIMVSTRVDERRSPFDRAAQQASMRSLRTVLDGVVMGVPPGIRAYVTLNPATAPSLFSHAPLSFERVLNDAEKSVAHSFPLGVHAVIHTESRQGDLTSSNVVGRLPGTTLARQQVVISAHLDHLGSSGSGPDPIYNGALDNASGIAALIEIARELAAGPRPARSIVFVAFTGEENGGIGSQSYVSRTATNTTVAGINMDMFTMVFPVADVVALGADHSTLGPLARVAAAKAGFETSPDPQPEEVRFIRSDQYAFVKRGIPAMIFKPGFKSRDASIDGDKISRDWLRAVYHTVNDGPDQKLDYDSGARWADANLNLVLAVANAPRAPRWNEGDFFGEKFGPRKR